jgi:hypothetical protein
VFALPGRKVADGRLNCQNQVFGSMSEIISLLEHEWDRQENSDLFRASEHAIRNAPAPSKSSHTQIRKLLKVIFLWVSDRSFQLYFCKYDFPSETISVSIDFF